MPIETRKFFESTFIECAMTKTNQKKKEAEAAKSDGPPRKSLQKGSTAKPKDASAMDTGTSSQDASVAAQREAQRISINAALGL